MTTASTRALSSNFMPTALFHHPDFALHDNGPRHPEREARMSAILEKLREENLLDSLAQPQFEAASEDDIARAHTREHIALIRDLAQSGGGQIDGDTRVGAQSYDVARLACGAAISATARVLAGECDNAFVVARPPGHHAESNRAMGFCLFNTVAVAARYALEVGGLQRVAILDFDVHHGNGTQEIFYEDSKVFFASLHQWPLYPGTGAAHETGAGAGIGTTKNIPLPAGYDDDEYIRAWRTLEAPLREYSPQMIFISAGFDAHVRDPLGSMNVTAQGFATMAKIARSWAREMCGGKLVCVLEGGYDLQGLSESVAAVVKELMR